MSKKRIHRSVKLENGDEEEVKLLDEAFKSYIDDMKPFVLSLPEKQDRQRIALWIKKLCGPIGLKMSERKNRNLYAQILFQMLRKGWIHEPFDGEPMPGALQILPAYLAKYFEKEQESLHNAKAKFEQAPDWIRGELPSSDSAFSLRRLRPEAESEMESSTSPETPRRSMGKYFAYSKDPRDDNVEDSQVSDPSLSDSSQEIDSLDELSDDLMIQENKKKNPRFTPPPSYVRRQIPDLKEKVPRNKGQREALQLRRSLSRSPDDEINMEPSENSKLRTVIQELQNKLKASEAKLIEERIKLQGERDASVQKVIDRKNTEMEGVKSHCRSKTNELEDNKRRLEKKVVKLTRELNQAGNRNVKEVEELKAIIQQNKVNAEHELERRVLERVADFEQEKFDMQKEHAQNIQELLEETNDRLKKIENEYTQKIDDMEIQLKEMEKELYQVKRTRDNYKLEKEEIGSEKEGLKERLVLSNQELESCKAKMKEMEKKKNELMEHHDKVLRDLRRKTDLTVASMKKEHSSTAGKTSAVISELEGKINHLRQSLEDMELQRKRDLREQESSHKQDMIRLEVNHDKTVRNLKGDADKTEAELESKIRIAEQSIKEKSSKIVQLEAQLADQQLQAQSAIENFRNQAEENSKTIFQEMKQQISKVESDLENALRENSSLRLQSREELGILKQRYENQVAEMKRQHEVEKEQLLKDTEAELESQTRDCKNELEDAKTQLKERIKDLEESLLNEKDRNIKKLTDSDQTIKDLREEVIQANSLRKQQLVELGLLRDEEKKNFKHQEESMQAKFRSQLEQQRLSLQKEHSSSMEKMLEETNAKLKQIESEYAVSSERNQKAISDLENQILEANGKLSREQSHSQVRILEIVENYDNEKEDLKKQHENFVKSLSEEVELHRTKSRHYEKQCYELELQSQESITKLKLQYEEKIRGLLPNSVRMELEETINALREQISLMQSRATLLQEELENRDGLSHSFGNLEPQMTSSRH